MSEFDFNEFLKKRRIAAEEYCDSQLGREFFEEHGYKTSNFAFFQDVTNYKELGNAIFDDLIDRAETKYVENIWRVVKETIEPSTFARHYEYQILHDKGLFAQSGYIHPLEVVDENIEMEEVIIERIKLDDENKKETVEMLTNENIKRAEEVLADNGIEQDEVQTVLQAIGYALLDKELYPGEKIEYVKIMECAGAYYPNDIKFPEELNKSDADIVRNTINLSSLYSYLIKKAALCDNYNSDILYTLEVIDEEIAGIIKGENEDVNNGIVIDCGIRDSGIDGNHFVKARLDADKNWRNSYLELLQIVISAEGTDIKVSLLQAQ